MCDEHVRHSHKELCILWIIEMSTPKSKKKESVSRPKIVPFVCNNEGCVRGFAQQKSLTHHQKVCKKPKKASEHVSKLDDDEYQFDLAKRLGDTFGEVFGRCLLECNVTILKRSDRDTLRKYQAVLDGTGNINSIDHILTSSLGALEEWRDERGYYFDFDTKRKLLIVVDELRILGTPDKPK